MMQSFRTRLTAWTVAILAIALLLFGSAMVLATNAQTMADIDRELMARARGPGGRGPQGPPGMRGDRRDQPDLGEGQPRQTGQLDRPNNFQRFADIRRPRHFSIEGGNGDEFPFDQKALDRALKGNDGFSEATFQDIPLRIFTLPQRDPSGEVVGAWQVARDLTDVQRGQQTLLWILLLFIPAAIVIAGIGALVLTGRAMQPISQMQKTAATISAEDLSQRIDVKGNDELAQLGLSFNQMVDRLEDSFTELRNAFESQRRFTADASHELRTPLTRLKLALDSLPPMDPSDPSFATAQRSVEVMTKLVGEMLVLARADSGNLLQTGKKVDLRLAASDAVNLVDPDGKRVAVDFDDSPVYVDGDSGQLERVAINLLENALRYSDGAVFIRVFAINEGAELEVSDHGVGIAREHLPHLTERFFRVDESRSREDGGCGLGLAICDTIIKAHGGFLEIRSEVGEGTTVKVFLPFSKSNNSQINKA